MRVLHVEDDANVRRTTERILSEHGVAYYFAQTVAEAEDITSREGFDVIVCDGTLSGSRWHRGDGIALAEELSADGHRVIIMSGDMYRGNLPYIQKGDSRGAVTLLLQELGLTN